MDQPSFWADLIGRLSGPMTFRVILQPTMAALMALRDGIKDAKAGRPAYFWTIFANAEERGRLLKQGWSAVLRIIVLGVVMDLIYQWKVFGTIHLVELIIVVLVLAFVPYLLLRGPVNRIARRWLRPKPTILPR